MIKINNLNKYYNKGKNNEIHVINDVKLELPNTGLVTFLGESGSGKTTLLNAISGLDSYKGEIIYDDVTLNNYNMKKIDKYRKENIGYIFQSYYLLPNETVYNNLKLALDIIEIRDEKEVSKRIEYALKMVGMYKYRKKPAYALSGGQMQRVAIARSLIKESKILICDEPTGNLDNDNTIGVMNILKAVSKTTLVLLVTHDKKIANVYSDLIFEIKDGAIINKIENESFGSLKADQNNIYLKDLNEYKSESEAGNITLYSNNPANISIKLYEKNGTYYLESDSPIKLLSNTNIKILDEKYEDIKVEDNNFTYEPSYDNTKSKRSFKSVLMMIRDSFRSLVSSKKRIKFLYFCLAIIGFLMSFSFILISNTEHVDLSDTQYDKNYYSAYDARDNLINYYNCKPELKPTIMKYGFVYFYKQLTCNYANRYSDYLGCMKAYDKLNIIKGTKINDKYDCIISSDFMDSIIAESENKLTESQILNTEVTMNSIDYKIVGVTDSGNKMIYFSEELYETEILSMNYSKGSVALGSVAFLGVAKTYLDVNNITLSSGVLPSNDDEVVVSSAYKKALESTITTDEFIWTSSTKKFTVKGIIESDELICLFNSNDVAKDYLFNVSYVEKANYDTTYENKLKTGEALASIYSTLEVGDKVELDNDYYITIVGKFIPKSELKYQKVILSARDNEILYLTQGDHYSTKVVFSEDDMVEGYKYLSVEELYRNGLAISEDRIIGLIVSLVILGIGAIFIYFVMRSRMVSDIYDIGVYRAIGGTKKSVIFKYFLEAMILTTISTIIGYFLGYIIYMAARAFADDLFGAMVFVYNGWYFLAGIIIIYLFMILFGLLPILMLLRKTPKQIINKYDI